MKVVSYFWRFEGLLDSEANMSQEFLPSSCPEVGERRMKDTDHFVVHSVVHLANHGSEKDSRDLESAKLTNWARRDAVLGWNDPAFFAPARPKSFSGSFQPT
jgi:hypothetical protein